MRIVGLIDGKELLPLLVSNPSANPQTLSIKKWKSTFLVGLVVREKEEQVIEEWHYVHHGQNPLCLKIPTTPLDSISIE